MYSSLEHRLVDSALPRTTTSPLVWARLCIIWRHLHCAMQTPLYSATPFTMDAEVSQVLEDYNPLEIGILSRLFVGDYVNAVELRHAMIILLDPLRGLEEQWENRTSTALETAFGSASLPPSSTWTTPPTPTYQEISTVIDEVLQLQAITPID